ncbi:MULTISPECIES: HDOD domain-containing protein [Vibrio]|uniref:HDOD domain-containing protein n=1 Tax=Vibrio TaxID=662 RepID=UPI00126969FB|nr:MULTISPECIES: HDOD domain-containing protein [Vibrio]QFT39930.1 HDOD domain protein [Vibrio sp. THAF64]QGM37563.1 HDOD domain protein [Vibrio sp. THAF191d]QGN73288.1 HDOD domain protein [Vibrio sp. THAF191c]WFB51194.1 HDOD domain-containing protein [Vibrio coralliilyticus]
MTKDSVLTPPNTLMGRRRLSIHDRHKMEQLTSKVMTRYHLWLVNHKYALQHADDLFLDEQWTKYRGLSEEDEAISQRFKRELLECEQASQSSRQDAHAEKLKVQSRVMQNVENTLKARLATLFQEADLSKLLNPVPDFSYLVSVAYQPSLSFSRLYPMCELNRALSKQVIHLAKSPRFSMKGTRRTTALDDPKVALAQLGIENCRRFLPLLMARPLATPTDGVMSSISNKVWQHLLVCANATHHRLEEAGVVSPEQGMLLGTIRHLGLLVVINHFQTQFEEALLQVMQDYRQSNCMTEYFACSEIKMPLVLLPQLLQRHERGIVERLIAHIDWGPSAMPLARALLEDLEDAPLDTRSIYGVALGQGRAFAVFDNMDKNQIFPTKFAPHWFANVRLSGEALSKLQQSHPGMLKPYQ